MRFSKHLAWLLVVPLLGTLLAACGHSYVISTPHGKVTCTVAPNGSSGSCSNNGQTYSVAPGGHASGPADHRTPVPTVSTPQATTPQASPVVATSAPAPQSSFDANAVSAVENCMQQYPSSAHDTLVSFSTSADARSNMAVCLQMPPQTVALFLHLLFKYAYEAYIHGDFDSQQGQQGFIDTTQGDTLPAAVIRCDKHYT